jgi:REP element-mobilizing transposase RayT
MCACRRRPLLASPPGFEVVRKQLLQSAAHHWFSVLAYCAMPDHLHLLVEAEGDTSDLRVFVWDFKRRTALRQATGAVAEGFYARVLRGDELADRGALPVGTCPGETSGSIPAGSSLRLRAGNTLGPRWIASATRRV